MSPFLRWLLLLIGTASLLPGRARAEGSKQLTPNTTGTTTVLSDPTNTRSGYLSHDVNIAGAGVIRSGAELPQAVRLRLQRVVFSEGHRMFVRVKAGEMLLYGVHRANNPITDANQRDPILTLRFRAVVGS